MAWMVFLQLDDLVDDQRRLKVAVCLAFTCIPDGDPRHASLKADASGSTMDADTRSCRNNLTPVGATVVSCLAATNVRISCVVPLSSARPK